MPAVLLRELFGRDSRCLEDARIEDELPRSGRPRRVDVRHRLRSCLDSGFTGALRTGGCDNALLSRAKTDDRRCRDPERKYDGQHCLATLVAH
jgi:hypothetical protein